ncbi:hypothetical protein M885DRAFT_511078 [Pelagophyceae sp. CCMP2097]|nr:hypothetical protein M885DRAFT_511078 [Pelagophyceae sp. CCMP2097]
MRRSVVVAALLAPAAYAHSEATAADLSRWDLSDEGADDEVPGGLLFCRSPARSSDFWWRRAGLPDDLAKVLKRVVALAQQWLARAQQWLEFSLEASLEAAEAVDAGDAVVLEAPRRAPPAAGSATAAGAAADGPWKHGRRLFQDEPAAAAPRAAAGAVAVPADDGARAAGADFGDHQRLVILGSGSGLQAVDAGPKAALESYARACERYSTNANGAVMAALRFGSLVIKPARTSPQAFGDAGLLAVVDALCEGATAARALDLTDVDGAAFTPGCAARALAHALGHAGGGGLAYLAVDSAPLGGAGADRLAQAVSPNARAVKVAHCGLGDRGANAWTKAVNDKGRTPRLERLDVSRNRIGFAALESLRTAAKQRRPRVFLEARGNALRVEGAAAAINVGAAAIALGAAAYLARQATTLELDADLVSSLAVYGCATSAYFCVQAVKHCSELALGGGARHVVTETAAFRAVDAAAGLVLAAGLAAPFAAFVELPLPKSAVAHLFGVAALSGVVGLVANRHEAHNLAPTSRAPQRKAALALLGRAAAVVATCGGPRPFLASVERLRAAIGEVHFRRLATSVFTLCFASPLHTLGGNAQVFAHCLVAAAALTHYETVLNALVWHYLPAAADEPSAAPF